MKKISLQILMFYFTVNAQETNKFFMVENSVKPQKFFEILEDNIINSIKENTIVFKCKNEVQLEYTNNNSEDSYVEFQKLGNIKDSQVEVILKVTYNNEEYILINTKDCKELTLRGMPLRIENSNKYLTFNNPSTDQRYRIQLLEFKNGFFVLNQTIIIPSEIIPQRVLRIERNEAYIIDIKGKTWKTQL